MRGDEGRTPNHPARKAGGAVYPAYVKGTPNVKAISAAVLAIAATTAEAQNRNCADRERVVERLSSAYGESRQSIGLGANNAVIEVFASLETGTWTITVTNTAGLTCLVASGMAYEATPGELLPLAGEAL